MNDAVQTFDSIPEVHFQNRWNRSTRQELADPGSFEKMAIKWN